MNITEFRDSNDGSRLLLRAIMLLAIEPGLKGLLIAGAAGSGKSALARSYQRFLPSPWREIPLGITEDRLLGSREWSFNSFESNIDNQRLITNINYSESEITSTSASTSVLPAMSKRILISSATEISSFSSEEIISSKEVIHSSALEEDSVFSIPEPITSLSLKSHKLSDAGFQTNNTQPSEYQSNDRPNDRPDNYTSYQTLVIKTGLLSVADNGTVYLDNINLLANHIGHQIGAALSSGEVVLEREGISTRLSANFVLIGSYDPAEGEVSPAIQDRVGLAVTLPCKTSLEQRAQLMACVLTQETRSPDPTSTLLSELELATAQEMIESARNRLVSVVVSAESRERLCLAALELGVTGNRADIFALKAARANAALAGRTMVDDQDLTLAIQLVLLPRATTLPNYQSAESEPDRSEDQTPDQTPATTSQDNNGDNSDDSLTESDREQSDNLSSNPPSNLSVDELIIAASESALPAGLLTTPLKQLRRSSLGSRGATLNRRRGRFIRAIAGSLKDGQLAITATIRAALQRGQDKERLSIKSEDLRIKQLKQKAGMLFIFAVDASGSMAINRVNQAKGALTKLLQQAYIHRDKVALISFRSDSARVMLPISQSVERAKRAVDELPIGGGTPLSSALVRAIELARQARRMGIKQVMLLLFTDGRANVALREIAAGEDRVIIIEQELQQLSAALQQEQISIVVIDTENRFTGNGAGVALAKRLAARYLYLPRVDQKMLNKTLSEIVAEQRD